MDKKRKQEAFWQEVMSKYEKKNTSLEQQQCKILSRIQDMERRISSRNAEMQRMKSQYGGGGGGGGCSCSGGGGGGGGFQASKPVSQKSSIPACDCRNRGPGCECDVCEDSGRKATPGGIRTNKSKSALSQKSSKVACDCKDRASACNCDVCEDACGRKVGAAASKYSNCDCMDCIIEICQQTGAELCGCSKKGKSASPKVADECDCLSSPTTGKMSGNDSTFSIDSADLLYIAKITELASRDKQMKAKIKELENREQSYLSTLKQADEMWACLEECYKKRLSDVEENGDSSRMKFQNMSRQLKEENAKLADEVKDMRLELKQCRERVEGPLTRKLEQERRKSENLENELKFSSQKMAKRECECMKGMDTLRNQLDSTCRKLCEISAANESLKKQMCCLRCNYEAVQQDLINQKISEGRTLQQLNDALLAERARCAEKEKSRSTKKECKDYTLHEIARNLSQTLLDIKNCSQCSQNIPSDLTDTVEGIKIIVDLVDTRGKSDGGAGGPGGGPGGGSGGSPGGGSGQSGSDQPSPGGGGGGSGGPGPSDETPNPGETPEGEASGPVEVDKAEVSEPIETEIPEPVKVGEGDISKSETYLQSSQPQQIPLETCKHPNYPSCPCFDLIGRCPCEVPTGAEKFIEIDQSKQEKLIEAKESQLTNKSEQICDCEPIETDNEVYCECSQPAELIIEDKKSEPQFYCECATPVSICECAAAVSNLEPPSLAGEEGDDGMELEAYLENGEGMDIEVETEILLRGVESGEINITATVTGSGVLEVVTEGPEGTIETTMTYTESGHIEIVTEVTDYTDREHITAVSKASFVASKVSAGAIEFGLPSQATAISAAVKPASPAASVADTPAPIAIEPSTATTKTKSVEFEATSSLPSAQTPSTFEESASVQSAVAPSLATAESNLAKHSSVSKHVSIVESVSKSEGEPSMASAASEKVEVIRTDSVKIAESSSSKHVSISSEVKVATPTESGFVTSEVEIKISEKDVSVDISIHTPGDEEAVISIEVKSKTPSAVSFKTTSPGVSVTTSIVTLKALSGEIIESEEQKYADEEQEIEEGESEVSKLSDEEDLRAEVSEAINKANRDILEALEQANIEVAEALARASQDVENALELALESRQPSLAASLMIDELESEIPAQEVPSKISLISSHGVYDTAEEEEQEEEDVPAAGVCTDVCSSLYVEGVEPIKPCEDVCGVLAREKLAEEAAEGSIIKSESVEISAVSGKSSTVLSEAIAEEAPVSPTDEEPQLVTGEPSLYEATSDDVKSLAASEEAKYLAASDEAASLAASEEAKSLAASEEAKSFAASEEAKSIAASEEAKSIAASEEAKSLAASEEAKSIAASEEAKSVAASEEAKSIAASEEAKSIAASEEAKSVAASEEAKSLAASEEIKPQPVAQTEEARPTPVLEVEIKVDVSNVGGEPTGAPAIISETKVDITIASESPAATHTVEEVASTPGVEVTVEVSKEPEEVSLTPVMEEPLSESVIDETKPKTEEVSDELTQTPEEEYKMALEGGDLEFTPTDELLTESSTDLKKTELDDECTCPEPKQGDVCECLDMPAGDAQHSPDCDCLDCLCNPCTPDPRDNKCHPFDCDCIDCLCNEEMVNHRKSGISERLSLLRTSREEDIKQMLSCNTANILPLECDCLVCRCTRDTGELKEIMQKIKCSCYEAELGTMEPSPKQIEAYIASYGNTISGIQLALSSLEEKTANKDHVLAEMIQELKTCTDYTDLIEKLEELSKDRPSKVNLLNQLCRKDAKVGVCQQEGATCDHPNYPGCPCAKPKDIKVKPSKCMHPNYPDCPCNNVKTKPSSCTHPDYPNCPCGTCNHPNYPNCPCVASIDGLQENYNGRVCGGPEDQVMSCRHPDYPNCPCNDVIGRCPCGTSTKRPETFPSSSKPVKRGHNCACPKKPKTAYPASDNASVKEIEKLQIGEHGNLGKCSCQPGASKHFEEKTKSVETMLSSGDAVSSSDSDSKSMEVTDVRKIARDTLLVKWTPPNDPSVTGYEVSVNGECQCKVHSAQRTSAVLDALEIKSKIRIDIHAMNGQKRCNTCATAIYQA